MLRTPAAARGDYEPGDLGGGLALSAAALTKGRNCLVLTNWTKHLQAIADALRALGHEPVTLKGGMDAKDWAAALARLTPNPASRPCSPSPPARTPEKG